MVLWINKKRFWVVKFIYKNKSLNNSIKYDKSIIIEKWEWESEWESELEWEWEWEWKWKWKWKMKIKLWINKKNIFLISCQVDI